MKVGDLVRLKAVDDQTKFWRGLVIGWDSHTGDPVIFWNNEFPKEHEYRWQVEVVCEGR